MSELFDSQPIPGAPFGLEVKADLSGTFSDAEKAALRRLFEHDGLLLFRNQSLTMDQQLDASEIFGPVLRGALDNYIVSNVEEDGLLGDGELLFHVDVPYVPAPYLGGTLHGLDVDEGVSATRFASAFRAWESLPEDLQRRIDGMTVLHVRGRELGRRTTLSDSQPGDNCAVHSLIGRQEGTGRPLCLRLHGHGRAYHRPVRTRKATCCSRSCSATFTRPITSTNTAGGTAISSSGTTARSSTRAARSKAAGARCNASPSPSTDTGSRIRSHCQYSRNFKRAKVQAA